MLNDLIAQASNIKKENESVYTSTQFSAMYPQFEGVVPDTVITSFIELGNNCVSDRRYGKMWELAIGLFIAHFCALYMQSAKEAGTAADDVLAAAASAGVVTSESADGVSYSMDTSALSSDLNGWAAFKLTTFGVQFATIAKLVGKGGMYVW